MFDSQKDRSNDPRFDTNYTDVSFEVPNANKIVIEALNFALWIFVLPLAVLLSLI